MNDFINICVIIILIIVLEHNLVTYYGDPKKHDD